MQCFQRDNTVEIEMRQIQEAFMRKNEQDNELAEVRGRDRLLEGYT